MVRLDTHALVEAVWHAAWLQRKPGGGTAPTYDARALERLRQCLARCAANARSMGLESLAESAADAHAVLQGKVEPDLVDLRRRMDLFAARARTEFREECFLQVRPDARTLVASDEPPFGHDVALSFPRAADDIDEAAKCLAMERPTASVFHLMRVMEFALEAAVAALRIPFTDHAWERVIAQIGEAAHRHPDRSWIGVMTRLYLVKRTSLNDRMQPRYAYTLAQAQDVYRAVQSFLVHLSPLVR